MGSNFFEKKFTFGVDTYRYLFYYYLIFKIS